MTTQSKIIRNFISSIIIFIAVLTVKASYAQAPNQMVRIAKIQVDPAQLENYKAALKASIETSVSKEPGVLSYYAVADKTNPSHITILEVYASAEAYQAHIQTPHFKKYKDTVKDMVKSLELVDVEPVASAAKPRQ